MKYLEYAPPPGTEGYVRCLWTLQADDAAHETHPVLPDGCPEVIVNVGDPCVAAVLGASPKRQPRLSFVGQITRPIGVLPTGALEILGVRLAPAGGSLLHRPMASLTNAWIDASRRFLGNVGRSREGEFGEYSHVPFDHQRITRDERAFR